MLSLTERVDREGSTRPGDPKLPNSQERRLILSSSIFAILRLDGMPEAEPPVYTERTPVKWAGVAHQLVAK
jgi:hypothetical protein